MGSSECPDQTNNYRVVWSGDKNWIRRLGTGAGFAFAKLSEVLPRSERLLTPVRMTDWASAARFGQHDKKKECVGANAGQPNCDVSIGCPSGRTLGRGTIALVAASWLSGPNHLTGDEEPVPASMARSCPRSFRFSELCSLRSG
jgi:hypothetical protein